MQRGKEIIIYLLFVVFSVFLWIMLVRNQKSVTAQQTIPSNYNDEIVVDPVTDKKIQVDVSVDDVPEGERVRVLPSRVTVYLRVRLSDYDKVGADDVRVWCSYPIRSKDLLPLHTDVSNQCILQVRTEPQEVEYIIERD